MMRASTNRSRHGQRGTCIQRPELTMWLGPISPRAYILLLSHLSFLNSEKGASGGAALSMSFVFFPLPCSSLV